MAYTPTDWECGQTVTAEKLNNIERGVAEVNSEYTPTTWQCGDLITAEAMNKIEQGIANAGGGSSDFSTATVTVNKEGTGDIPLNMSLPLPVVIENPSTHEKILGIVATPYNGTFVVPLYESRCYVGASGDWDSEWFSASGGVTRQGGAGFLIEGDGTITITIND